MSILEKCEKIGLELRRTPEGKNAIKYFTAIKDSPEEFKGEFFKLINSNYIKIHFFSVPNAVEVLENNTENSILGTLVKKLLSIEGIKEFGEANIPIGHFVEKLSVMSFNNSVKYQLPTDVTAMPALVRLSNSLTVECQRINLVQQFVKEYYTNPRFLEAINRFDKLRGAKPILPFSKEDRNILKTIKREYPDTKVNLIYSLISILTYIKCMIFDSFYDNIFEISEAEDIISRRQKSLDSCSMVKLSLVPNKKTLGPNTGWILKLHNNDGSISYAQIFNKKMKWTQTETTVIIKVFIYDNL